MRKTFLALLCMAIPLCAATFTVTVDRPTPTQAVLHYSHSGTCTFTATEYPAGLPSATINDANGTLFPGSNSDIRIPSSLVNGPAKTLVLGKNSADLATDGSYYSRALRANTLHAGTITCGADTGSYTFTTANAAAGNSVSQIVPYTQQRLSNLTQLCSSCERVDVCQSGCTTNAEVLYDAPTGGTCPNGGTAYQIWSMARDGSHKVNLSATAAGLTGQTLNMGNAHWSPDGQWFIVQIQAAASNLACNSNQANPGSGIDNNLWICNNTASTCRQMTAIVHGLGTGTLHAYWTHDMAYVFWMRIQGLGHTNVGFWGDLRSTPFSTPAGVPTFGTLTDFTDGANAFNWYEPASANPTSNCTVYVTSGPTYDAVRIFSFNVCAQSSWSAITPLGLYSEFWNCDPTGKYAVGMSTKFTPTPTPASYPFAPPPAGTDLVLSDCLSAAEWSGISTYNTPGTAQYIGGIAVSHPVWSQGMTQILYTVQNSGSNSIWAANFNTGNALWGNQAWPSMSWNAQGQYIDPLTGLVVERITGPGQSQGGAGINSTVVGYDLAGAWTTAGNITGSSGYASTSAKGQGNGIFIPAGSVWFPGPGFQDYLSTDDLQAQFKAYTDTMGDTASVCLSVHHGSSCVGNAVALTLPVGIGSAATVSGPGSFPSPLFAGWGQLKLTSEQMNNQSGVAAVSGTSVTLSAADGRIGFNTYLPLSLVSGDKILISGSSPTCTNNECTVASLTDESHLVISQNLGAWGGFATTLSGNISAGATTFSVSSVSGFVYSFLMSRWMNINFADGNPETVSCTTLSGTTFSGCSSTASNHSAAAAVNQKELALDNFGFLVWNSGSSGSVFLQNAQYSLAGSNMFSISFDGSYNPCSVTTVTVSYASDGTTPITPVPGRTCTFIDISGNPGFYLFIPSTGETRLIGYSTATMGSFQEGNISAADPNTVYYSQNNSSNPNVYSCVYDAATLHYAALAPNYSGTTSLTCTNLTSGVGNDLLSQIGRVSGLNTAFYFTRISGFGPVAGNLISVTVQAGGQGSIGAGCYFDVTKSAGSQIVSCHDTWTTYPERWGGAHGQLIAQTNTGWGAIYLVSLTSPTSTGIGQYQLSVNSITGGSGSTALTSNVASDPTTQNCSTLGVTDPQWIALGATGNNCIQMIVATEPQNPTPSSADAAQWPSACHAGWAQLQTIQPGDYLVDGTSGFNENFLVALKTGSGCSPITLVLARAVNQTCASGAQSHSNGWTPVVIPTANCNGNNYWFQSSNPSVAYVDNSAAYVAHSFTGQADNTGTTIVSTESYAPQFGYTSLGVRSGVVPTLIGQPFSYALNMTYPFQQSTAGVGVNFVQSHPGGQSYLATPNTLGYDGRPLGAAGGGVPTAWYHTYTLVGGKTSTYLISCPESSPSGSCIDSLDEKRTAVIGFAGRFMLTDISGPGSVISDTTPYTFCIAMANNECVSGSVSGNRYVSVPLASVSGGACIVGNLDQNTPCLASVTAAVGVSTQYNWGAADPLAANWRRLGFALGGPGQTNNYWNTHGIVDASWAFTEVDWKEGVRRDIVAMQLPPWSSPDSVTRSQYVPVPVQVRGISGDTVRVEFGYDPSALYCTTRQESCFTSASATVSNPFVYGSEMQSYTACSSVCTVQVPARPSGMLYYRVHRLSGGVESVGAVQVVGVP